MKAQQPIEQDVDKWVRELTEAGWRKYKRRGIETMTMWVNPDGDIYRGPYHAWRVMKSMEQWG